MPCGRPSSRSFCGEQPASPACFLAGLGEREDPRGATHCLRSTRGSSGAPLRSPDAYSCGALRNGAAYLRAGSVLRSRIGAPGRSVHDYSRPELSINHHWSNKSSIRLRETVSVSRRCVRCIIVHDEVQRSGRWGLLIEQLHEPEPFLMAMPGLQVPISVPVRILRAAQQVVVPGPL